MQIPWDGGAHGELGSPLNASLKASLKDSMKRSMKHVMKYWILNKLIGPAPENALNIYIYIYVSKSY